MRFLLSILLVLLWATSVASQPANLGYQVNVLAEIFQRSNCKQIKMISGDKELIFLAPKRVENGYDVSQVYQEISVGRGTYINHDVYTRGTGDEPTWVITGVETLNFTYSNDGKRVYLEFDNNEEDPEDLYFHGKRELHDPTTKTWSYVFTLAPEVKHNFQTSFTNQVARFFKSNPTVNRLKVQKCVGDNSGEASCKKLDTDIHVINRDQVQLDANDAIEYLSKDERYISSAEGTLEMGRILERYQNYTRSDVYVNINRIQKDIGIYDAGYITSSGKRFTYYKFTY